MTWLGPTCTSYCVRSITYNAVTNGTHTHTHTHTHQSVQKNDKYKILWDLNIQRDEVIEHRPPDIVCIDKQKRECQIIDFALPTEQNIFIKEQEKNWKVPGLKNRITESLECQGSGHTDSYRCSQMLKRIHQYIKQIDILADIISIQKTAILGTAYILPQVLGI